MAIRYREDKATQAAALLIKLEDGEMNYMKLLKLLYLADRASLLQWGRPITFDSYFSMDDGPVLSFTYNKIGSPQDPVTPSYWHRHISKRMNYQVALIGEAPNGSLSPAEETLLDEVYSQHRDKDEWQLVEYTHDLPEWHDPHGSSLLIDISDILRTGISSEEEIQEIKDALEAESFANSLAD